MSESGDRSAEVRVERLLPASPEDVFDFWTDPALMARWLSPVGQAQVEADVRVGGHLRLVMVGGGMRIEHNGEYLEVDRPRRLSFTWRSPYTGDSPSLVTVVLTPQGSDTHLLLVHQQLPNEAVPSHEGGWGQMLDRLADALRSTTPDQIDQR